MAIELKSVIAGKITALFLDNDTQEISEADLREVVTDILDTFVNLKVDANNIEFGDGADSANKVITIANGDDMPAIRYNVSTNKWQFANDGSTWQDFGSGGGVSGLNPDEITFGETGGAGTLQQSTALKFLNATTRLVLGSANPTEFDGAGVLRILHDVTDYIRVLGKGVNENGRLALASNGSALPADFGAFNNGGGSDAFMRFANTLGGATIVNIEMLRALLEIKGKGSLSSDVLNIYDQNDNIIFQFKNRAEFIGYYTGLLPAAGTDSASFYINNSKINGVAQDGNASWHIITEDGKVIDTRFADIRVITRELAYPLEDSKPFEFKGNSSVFQILGVVFDPTKIASVDYQVRRPALGLPAGLVYEDAADLNDVIAWHGGSNTIDGGAYNSPSTTDHIDILPQVTWQTGWESTADFSFVIQILSS